MKLKNTALKNLTLTVSAEIHPDKEISLDEKGFVKEELTEKQLTLLATVPNFVICDDKGSPIAKAVEAEKKIVVVDDKLSAEELQQLLDRLAVAENTSKELEEKFKFLGEEKATLEEEVASLKLELENTRSENEELKAQLDVKGSGTDSAETKGAEGEQLFEGQKKIEDGKAWIVKKDNKGELKWYRDKENDPK